MGMKNKRNLRKKKEKGKPIKLGLHLQMFCK